MTPEQSKAFNFMAAANKALIEKLKEVNARVTELETQMEEVRSRRPPIPAGLINQKTWHEKSEEVPK